MAGSCEITGTYLSNLAKEAGKDGMGAYTDQIRGGVEVGIQIMEDRLGLNEKFSCIGVLCLKVPKGVSRFCSEQEMPIPAPAALHAYMHYLAAPSGEGNSLVVYYTPQHIKRSPMRKDKKLLGACLFLFGIQEGCDAALTHFGPEKLHAAAVNMMAEYAAYYYAKEGNPEYSNAWEKLMESRFSKHQPRFDRDIEALAGTMLAEGAKPAVEHLKNISSRYAAALGAGEEDVYAVISDLMLKQLERMNGRNHSWMDEIWGSLRELVT